MNIKINRYKTPKKMNWIPFFIQKWFWLESSTVLLNCNPFNIEEQHINKEGDVVKTVYFKYDKI